MPRCLFRPPASLSLCLASPLQLLSRRGSGPRAGRTPSLHATRKTMPVLAGATIGLLFRAALQNRLTPAHLQVFHKLEGFQPGFVTSQAFYAPDATRSVTSAEAPAHSVRLITKAKRPFVLQRRGDLEQRPHEQQDADQDQRSLEEIGELPVLHVTLQADKGARPRMHRTRVGAGLNAPPHGEVTAAPTRFRVWRASAGLKFGISLLGHHCCKATRSTVATFSARKAAITCAAFGVAFASKSPTETHTSRAPGEVMSMIASTLRVPLQTETSTSHPLVRPVPPNTAQSR